MIQDFVFILLSVMGIIYLREIRDLLEDIKRKL